MNEDRKLNEALLTLSHAADGACTCSECGLPKEFCHGHFQTGKAPCSWNLTGNDVTGKYVYGDVISNRYDPRIDKALGKTVYFGDAVESVLEHANGDMKLATGELSCTTGGSFLFRVRNELGWIYSPYIIRKEYR